MAETPPPGAPWLPAPYDPADILAVQALAQDGRHERALRWIVETVCRTYDLSFRPESERATAFAEGKRYVGLQIVKAIKLNPDLFQRETHARRTDTA